MKKTLSILLLLTVISSVVFANRIDNSGTATGAVVVKEGAIFKLYYWPVEQMDVKISIYDATDKIVFSEVLKKAEGFVRPYNFSNLPEGNYTIEIVDNSGRHTESVTYRKNNITALAHLIKIPDSEKYVLAVPNKDPGELTVRILDPSDNVIYDQKESVVGDFAKVYNLEEFSGNFVFEVTDGQGIHRSLSH